MRRSKSIALAFLVGALLIGWAAGLVAYPIMRSDSVCSGSDRASVRQRLADELGLTPTQRVGVDSILDRRNHDLNALVAPIRPQMDSVKDRARSDIMRLLDEGQQVKFRHMIQESQNARDKERKETGK